MKNLFNLCIIIPFLFIIFYFPIAGILEEDLSFSQEEYRNLTTIKDLEEKNFNSSTLEKYVVDQFPYRSSFLKLYTKQEMFLNKIFIRDSYLINKNIILTKEYPLNKKDTKSLFDLLSQKQKQFPNYNFYYATIPSKTYALKEYGKKYIDYSIVEKNKNIIESFIPKNIKYIDVNNFFDETFSPEEKLNLYYKTDFHWNGKGALEGALYILNKILKYENYNIYINKNEFNIQYLKDRNFLGDLNRRFSYLIEKDTEIPVFHNNHLAYSSYYKSIDNSKKIERKEIIQSGINLKNITYNDIYTPNLNFYKVVNNSAILDKKIVIFKDSFQNPTTDVFSYVFKECYIIDARFECEYTFNELMNKINPDITLFMFHQSNVSKELINYLNSNL